MRSWFSPARTRILLIIKKIHIQAWQLHFNGGQQDSGTLPTHRMVGWLFNNNTMYKT